MAIVTIKSLEKFISGAILDSDILTAMTTAELHGEKFIEVPQWLLTDMERRLAEFKIKQKQLADCVKLNNRGIAYEKAGKTKAAINVYEQNIESDYPAHHSFKRLMILYRKNKDYVNELQVVERALEVFPDEVEYQDRLNKVKTYIIKNK